MLDNVIFPHGAHFRSTLTPMSTTLTSKANMANPIGNDAGGSRNYTRRRMEDMPARIKQLRIARGLSQEQLAKHCQVTRAAVSQWESGIVTNIRLPAFMRLCEALATDPAYLIYGPDRLPPKDAPGGGAHRRRTDSTG